MLLFCRNCGKELSLTRDQACSQCGVKPTKATAYCRYCGHPTSVDDTVCPTCGATIRPVSRSLRLHNQKKQKLVKTGIILNLALVIGLILVYVVFTLPKSITVPIKSAAAQVIMDSTGYKTFPLSGISVVPTSIPPYDSPLQELRAVNEGFTPAGVAVNSTYQLTVFAVYQDTTKADITDKAIYKSDNELVATVNGAGLVTATGSGSTTISVTYTAAPGSSNMSNASAGKVPVTLNVDVPIIVQ
jgi:ribosomal protein L37E